MTTVGEYEACGHEARPWSVEELRVACRIFFGVGHRFPQTGFLFEMYNLFEFLSRGEGTCNACSNLESIRWRCTDDGQLGLLGRCSEDDDEFYLGGRCCDEFKEVK